MVSVVRQFDVAAFHFSWINAISRVGYIAITSSSDNSFVGMWAIGEKVGQFFRSHDAIKADAVGYHYFELPGSPATLCVIPRYTDDYEDNNRVYAIAEAAEQTETSSNAIITPLADFLEQTLSKQ